MCFSKYDPESFHNIVGKWMPEVHHYCPGVPYILVGITQVDEAGERAIQERLSKQKLTPVDEAVGMLMARNIGAIKYVECNLITKKGLKEVFDEVKRALGPFTI